MPGWPTAVSRCRPEPADPDYRGSHRFGRLGRRRIPPASSPRTSPRLVRHSLGGSAMIKKVKEGYKVLSEKGKNLGGPYKTKAEAEKRLRQVEFFKRRKG